MLLRLQDQLAKSAMGPSPALGGGVGGFVAIVCDAKLTSDRPGNDPPVVAKARVDKNLRIAAKVRWSQPAPNDVVLLLDGRRTANAGVLRMSLDAVLPRGCKVHDQQFSITYEDPESAVHHSADHLVEHVSLVSFSDLSCLPRRKYPNHPGNTASLEHSFHTEC